MIALALEGVTAFSTSRSASSGRAGPGDALLAEEVRVIAGDIEHVYGPGAQVLDDADLHARNQRALEHMRAEKQLATERGQASIEAGRLKLQEAALAYGIAQNWGSIEVIAPKLTLTSRHARSPGSWLDAAVRREDDRF
jgi:hypothetical protein